VLWGNEKETKKEKKTKGTVGNVKIQEGVK
jgi:hypothetical protein